MNAMTTLTERSAPLTAAPDQRQASGIRVGESIPGLSAILSVDGRIMSVNRAWTEMLGHARENVLDRRIAQFIHADHAAAFTDLLARASRSNQAVEADAAIRCQDGSHKWFYWRIRKADECSGFIVIAVDVSERKQEELRHGRKAYLAALRAEIWAALGKSWSPKSVLGDWANLLAASLEASLVGLWIVNEDTAEPTLAAVCHRPEANPKQLPIDLLMGEVRQAIKEAAPRSYVCVESQPAADPVEQLIRENGTKAILLYPIAHQNRVAMIIGACFARPSQPNDTFTVEKAAVDLGPALALVKQCERLSDVKRTHDNLNRTTSDAICCLDAQGRVSRSNPTAERLFGYAAAEFVGRPLPIFRGAESERFAESLRAAFAGNATAHVELKASSKDGTVLELGTSLSPIASADGVVATVLAVFTDLSSRKAAERRLTLEHAVGRVLAASSTTDETLKSILKLVGEHLGAGFGELWLAGNDHEPPQRKTSWGVSTPSAREFEFRSENWDSGEPTDLPTKCLSLAKPQNFLNFVADKSIDRSTLAQQCGFQDAFAVPVKAEQATVAGLVFFGERFRGGAEMIDCLEAVGDQVGRFLSYTRLQDAHKESLEKLRQAEKMEVIGRLVGGVAHDFNNLLTVILGYGELLLGQVESDAQVRESIVEIVESGKRASGLTRQLLAFCRKEVYTPVALDLNAHVESMEKMLKRLVGESIQFSTTLAGRLDHVQADPGQIEQVVMNLVVNARDAMPTGGHISIETETVQVARGQKSFPQAAPGSYVQLSVQDTGCGMDAATLARIFEPFFTTKGAGKGTGMGLATVQEIVAQCVGHISVESRPGAGSTFRVIFPPVSSGLSAWEVDSAPQAIPRGSETILVVEDETPVLRLMARVLRIQGYRVLEAGSGTEALQLLKTQPGRIDLLLTDVVMPDMHGLALAEQVKKLRGDTKVLYASGYRDSELRRLGMPDLEPFFLQKPFTSVDLATKIRQVLDNSLADRPAVAST
jgi:two-component system, cell cycle sensor histidine kinase and response regulator CckA